MLTWPDLTSRPRDTPDATIAYGPDPLQVIDLWRPVGAGPHPVVLMVHGGCWQTSIADRRLMDWVAADLREHGIAAWNIDYRGVDRAGGGYPGTFRDVAAAADRLRSDAAAHGLDLTRRVALGHSAGGHLALWLAARHRIAADSPLHDDERPVAPCGLLSCERLHEVEVGRVEDVDREVDRVLVGDGDLLEDGGHACQFENSRLRTYATTDFRSFTENS